MTLDQEIMQLAAELGIELVPGEVDEFTEKLNRVRADIKNMSEERYQALLASRPDQVEVIGCTREIDLEDES